MYSTTELSTKASGILQARKTVEAFKFGLMAHFMKATGQTTKLTAEVVLFTQMVMFTTVNGRMIRLMAMGFTIILMAPAMKVTGLKTSSTDMEKRFGQIARVTKENIKKVKSTVKANFCGLTDRPTLETSLITILKAEASTRGLIRDSMMVNG